MMTRNRLLKMHPASLVLLSFLAAIVLGALLLKLPIAVGAGAVSWVDAFFIATSAICVTGLTVVDIGSRFTLFGQCIILLLIQVGGLGVMTISVALFQWVGWGASIRQRLAMQELFAAAPRKDILSLVNSIIVFTVWAELIGAILLTICWAPELGFFKAAYFALFHSIAAFCNAGFALFPDNLIGYSGHGLLHLTICLLIVIGGIGFPVLYDLQCWVKTRKHGRCRLSIQTKTVLWTTLVLIIGGALMYAFLEREALATSSSWHYRIWVPLFQSITCRTAGFNTVDISSLREATLAVMIFLMFFGASPGSCGGGVKTTILALLTAFTLSRVRHGRRVNLFKKSVPGDTMARAFSLILVSIAIVCFVLFMLLMGDPVTASETSGTAHSFLGFLFETVSAFGTVGLSMGVTTELNTWGKGWIILMMIIGRVGILTFSYIIVGSRKDEGIEYAEENMMVG
ncbi:MAG: ATPase [Desulfobacterales bacterium]|nr:ATPase [Desulfobacterales bacterium]